MINEDHNCEKFEIREQHAKNLDEIYLSLSDETRKMVDFFIKELKEIKNAIIYDIEEQISALQEEGCHEITVSFTGMKGKEVKSGIDIVIHQGE